MLQRGGPRLVIGAAVVAGLLAAGVASAVAQDVTIGFQRYFDVACNCYKMRFFGAISSGAANEYVAVLGQKCGAPFSTAVAGAQTHAGGGWETDTYLGGASATYRARWQDDLSAPVTFRPALVPQVKKLGQGRYRVTVFPYAPENRPQNMKGRPVVLQRLAAGQWITVRTARLGSPPAYSATFTVPTQGLTLRVLLSAKSALPCFSAGVSKTFRS